MLPVGIVKAPKNGLGVEGSVLSDLENGATITRGTLARSGTTSVGSAIQISCSIEGKPTDWLGTVRLAVEAMQQFEAKTFTSMRQFVGGASNDVAAVET